MKKVIKLLAILLLAGLVIVIIVRFGILLYVRMAFDDPGQRFIRAIAHRNENLAMSLLSENAQMAVAHECKNGQVVDCFDEIGLREWGRLKTTHYVYGKANGSTAYMVVWKNTVHGVVIDLVQENDKTVVDGWRGFTYYEGEFPWEWLEHKEGVPNAFPPPTPSEP